MERLLSVWEAFHGWFVDQAAVLQIAVVLGIVAVVYVALMLIKITLVAIYATFRGL